MISSRCTLTLLATAGLTFLATTPATATLLKPGGPINGVAGQPGTFESCVKCHDTSLVNTGSGSVKLDVPSVYTPGQTYTISAKVGDPSALRWGFEMVALGADGKSAGTLTSTDAMTQVSHQGSTGRDFVKQTSSGTQIGTLGFAFWTYDWTAPAAGTGTVRFYVAGNAANADNRDSGDQIYTSATSSAETGAAPAATLTLQPDSSSVRRGNSFTVHAHVRDHTLAANNLLLATRVILPSGAPFPSTGWLAGPLNLSIVGGMKVTEPLSHFVPPTAPAMNVLYQGFIGLAPSTLIDLDDFVLAVTL